MFASEIGAYPSKASFRAQIQPGLTDLAGKAWKDKQHSSLLRTSLTWGFFRSKHSSIFILRVIEEEKGFLWIFRNSIFGWVKPFSQNFLQIFPDLYWLFRWTTMVLWHLTQQNSIERHSAQPHAAGPNVMKLFTSVIYEDFY